MNQTMQADNIAKDDDAVDRDESEGAALPKAALGDDLQ